MMWDAYDVWRLFNFLICAPCFIILIARYRQNHWRWGTKTADFWFALATWTFTGSYSSIEGIVVNAPPGLRVMFISVGGLVTLKALARKGEWGENKIEDANLH
jgi:hypothetical protein